MERLTKRVGCGEAIPTFDEFDLCVPFKQARKCQTGCLGGVFSHWERHCNDTCPLGKLIDRLAAYEDTGLEPEDVETIKAVYVPDHQELKGYRSIGTVFEFRALKEAEQKRREGCEFCHDQQNLMYYKFNEYVICPHCGRDLRGESHGT